MKKVVTALFTVLTLFANGQAKLNLKLKAELDSIFQLDQKYRELLFSAELKSNPDSVAQSYGIKQVKYKNF